MELNDKLFPLGDTAVIVQLGEKIDPETHNKVKILASYLDEHPFPGMVEYVPAFTTVTVYYDPLQVYDRMMEDKNHQGNSNKRFPYQMVCSILKQIVSSMEIKTDTHSRTVEIPVCYGEELGPDLEYVAEYHGISPEKVIQIHTQNEYLVYMIGFAPGFPYLGGMSETIATPRRETPRLSIPAGSVGIAGQQTGVYPIETPGGWQLIGRTPSALFRPKEDPPSLLKAGDKIRFYPISRKEFAARKEEI